MLKPTVCLLGEFQHVMFFVYTSIENKQLAIANREYILISEELSFNIAVEFFQLLSDRQLCGSSIAYEPITRPSTVVK
jgi:hypothetical protein